MNKKFLLYAFILSIFGAYAIFKLNFLFDGGLSNEVLNKIINDNEFRTKFRIYSAIAITIISSATSFICYKIAEKTGNDPLKWAKRGFLFNVYAIMYLLLIENSESKSSTT